MAKKNSQPRPIRSGRIPRRKRISPSPSRSISPNKFSDTSEAQDPASSRLIEILADRSKSSVQAIEDALGWNHLLFRDFNLPALRGLEYLTRGKGPIASIPDCPGYPQDYIDELLQPSDRTTLGDFQQAFCIANADRGFLAQRKSFIEWSIKVQSLAFEGEVADRFQSIGYSLRRVKRKGVAGEFLASLGKLEVEVECKEIGHRFSPLVRNDAMWDSISNFNALAREVTKPAAFRIELRVPSEATLEDVQSAVAALDVPSLRKLASEFSSTAHSCGAKEHLKGTSLIFHMPSCGHDLGWGLNWGNRFQMDSVDEWVKKCNSLHVKANGQLRSKCAVACIRLYDRGFTTKIINSLKKHLSSTVMVPSLLFVRSGNPLEIAPRISLLKTKGSLPIKARRVIDQVLHRQSLWNSLMPQK